MGSLSAIAPAAGKGPVPTTPAAGRPASAGLDFLETLRGASGNDLAGAGVVMDDVRAFGDGGVGAIGLTKTVLVRPHGSGFAMIARWKETLTRSRSSGWMRFSRQAASVTLSA